MVRMLKIYSKTASTVRSVPTMLRPSRSDQIGAGGSSGYTMGAKVLAFGYMRGIMEALKLPYA